MQRIREILLNEYIGAIAIGLLLVQAIGSALRIIGQTVGFYLEKSSRPHGVFAERGFPWTSVANPAINLVLYLFVIYLLLRWLYLKPAPPELTADADEEESEQQA